MRTIDLRSDTVTLPSPEMRQAMAQAELGDDVFGEDPSVNRLQQMAAERLGKEAALFTPSGTQSNLCAVLSHCRRGQEVILGEGAHILIHESGGAWAIGGFGMRTVRNTDRGALDLDGLEVAIRPGWHGVTTGLICLENTHNRCGGAVLNEEDLGAVREIADKHELPVHMDGARIFNAAVALGVPVSRLASYADSVCFSLSKGLGCPVGSVLCGTSDFIRRARRIRGMLGGGMRQAGVLAAAGIYALDNMIERLAEDHENALACAAALAAIPGVNLTPPPRTNMVYFTVEGRDSTDLERRLGEAGVLCFDEDGRLRWVTHYGIERADVEEAAAKLRNVVAAGA